MSVEILFMKDSNLPWSALLARYVNKEITPKELEELNRQMSDSPIKQQQFKVWTDPDELMKLLQELHSVNTDEPWKRLVTANPFLAKD